MTEQNLSPKPQFDNTAELIQFSLSSPMEYTVEKFSVAVTDEGLGPPEPESHEGEAQKSETKL